MQAAVKDKSRVEMVKRLVLCKNVSKAGRVCYSIERSAVFRWIFFVAERRAVWAHERSESESEGAFSRALLRKQAVDVKEVYISAVVQGSVTMLHCAWQITPCSPCLWDASCLTSSPVNWSNVGDLPAVTQTSLSQLSLKSKALVGKRLVTGSRERSTHLQISPGVQYGTPVTRPFFLPYNNVFNQNMGL